MAPDQVLVSGDEVLVRQPPKGAFAELRTARVVTRAGYRYVCGSGTLFRVTACGEVVTFAVARSVPL